MKKTVLLLFALSILLFGFSGIFTTAAATENYVFGTFPIPLMIIDKDTGVFIELTNEIAKRAGIFIHIRVTPPIRTLSNFRNNRIDAIFPAVDVNFHPGTQIEKSDSIYLKKDFSFTRKGSPFLKTISDLEGKTVGITRGYPYVKALIENKAITIEIANSDELNAKKLTSGRLDAFVVEEKTGLQAFKNIGRIQEVIYDSTKPLSTQAVYYAFPANNTGKILSEKVSDAMEQMRSDGTFNRIMSTDSP